MSVNIYPVTTISLTAIGTGHLRIDKAEPGVTSWTAMYTQNILQYSVTQQRQHLQSATKCRSSKKGLGLTGFVMEVSLY